jgi:hypothetical protein
MSGPFPFSKEKSSMIVIQSFKEMADLYQVGKVPIRVVQEVGMVLLGLCGYPKDIPLVTAISQQEIDWLLMLSEEIEFMTYLGGWVFLVETAEDLAEVTSMDIEFGKLHGRWPNCTEAVLGWDECKYLLNADDSSDYALLFAATNNAGGPSWFIPRHLWQAAQIDEQINAHQQFWATAAV